MFWAKVLLPWLGNLTLSMAFIAWFLMERPLNVPQRIIGAVMIIGLFTENVMMLNGFFSFRLGFFGTIHNLLELVLVVALVKAQLPQLRHWANVLGGIGLLLFGISILRQDDLTLSVTMGAMYTGVVMSILMVRALWEHLETREGDLWSHPEFWIYLGYLLYFVTRVPIMGSMMYIWERYPELSRSMFMMFQGVLVLRNILFVVACRKYRPAHA
jgi:hypothetical protein